MKKLFLIVLLALSLNGSSVMCEKSFEGVLKHNKLFLFASGRNDKADIELNVDLIIMYAERALAECGDSWKFAKATKVLREAMMDYSKELKNPDVP